MNDPIREAQARASEFNAGARRAAGSPPERIALQELVAAVERCIPCDPSSIDGARLVLAMNAARNALKVRP